MRLLLAICVVFGHVSLTGIFTGPTTAVQAFYIISGFYIAMVLQTTKAYGKKSAFYLNRYLRLYPIYACVALLAFLLKFVSEPGVVARLLALPVVAKVVLAVANLTLFTGDWVMFLGVHRGHLALVRDVHAAQPYGLYHWLAVQPAWSLGCELSFYLLAPFLVRMSNRCLAASVGLTLVGRWIAAKHGLAMDPWSYRFFPFELGIFCLGILAYRLYSDVRTRPWFYSKRVRACVLALFFGFTVLYSEIHFPGARPLYLMTACAVIPMLFDVSRNARWDRAIGELSYPVYIVHHLVLDVWLAVPWCRHWCAGGLKLSFVITAVSIAAAWMLNRFVQSPVERLRSRRKAASSELERKETQLGVPAAAE